MLTGRQKIDRETDFLPSGQHVTKCTECKSKDIFRDENGKNFRAYGAMGTCFIIFFAVYILIYLVFDYLHIELNLHIEFDITFSIVQIWFFSAQTLWKSGSCNTIPLIHYFRCKIGWNWRKRAGPWNLNDIINLWKKYFLIMSL